MTESVKKQRIALIFGGPGPEHGVSCLSARAIWKAMDRRLFEPIALGWTPAGNFVSAEDLEALVDWAPDPRDIQVRSDGDSVPLDSLSSQLDAAFPIVHGLGGEDGSLQGWLQVQRIPYVGADPTACMLAWHKGLCKTVLAAQGLPVVPWRQLTRGRPFGNALEEFPYPVFVKPATSGSSVGVSRATDDESFFEALESAWVYSRDILIEPALKVRELEVGILNGQASPVGEIVSHQGFYSYEAKYLDPLAATIVDKPDLPPGLAKRAQNLAQQAAQILGCEAFCRVDLFYNPHDDTLYINEINTHPGFTEISMYPKLWAQAGLDLTALVTRLLRSSLKDSG